MPTAVIANICKTSCGSGMCTVSVFFSDIVSPHAAHISTFVTVIFVTSEGDRDTIPASSPYSMPHTSLIITFVGASSVLTHPPPPVVRPRRDARGRPECLHLNYNGGLLPSTPPRRDIEQKWRDRPPLEELLFHSRVLVVFHTHTHLHAIMEIVEYRDHLGGETVPYGASTVNRHTRTPSVS